ncbi:MAG: hypothetical protein PHI06_13650 [Desulfobulbaceae bacterium]|nr:hypothetical protein [Desulfobulbaceae bacterium]
MKKTIAIASLLVMLPVAALAAHKAPAGPSKSAIDACVGKAVGTAVEMPGMQGKMVAATCQDVKGKLIAVPTGHK